MLQVKPVNFQKRTSLKRGKNRKELDARDKMKISEKISLYTNLMEACSQQKLLNINIVMKKTMVGLFI